MLLLIVISLFLNCIISMHNAFASEVLGCGGYIKSEVDINYSQVSLKLLTAHGNKKYETECAPNNGYYFIPLYDKGDYILKVFPPSGWTFEPNEVSLRVDGETDPCSLNQDINFHFKGFAVVGKVISVGSDDGPAGVSVTLNQGSKRVMTTKTNKGGGYVFTPLASGMYEVQASHPTWMMIKSKVSVSVKDENGDAGSSLVVGGYSLTGRVETEGKVDENLIFVLHSKVKVFHQIGCSVGTPARYESQLLEPALCYVTTDSKGVFKFSGLSPATYVVVPYSQSEIKYEISPASFTLQMAHNDFVVKEAFQIDGCRIRGTVYRGKNKAVIEGARVTLNDDAKIITDGKGTFTFNGVKFGMHSLQVAAEGVEFDVLKLALDLSTTTKVEIFPSKFNTCFFVSVDSATEKRTPWSIDVTGLKSMQILMDSNSEGCLMLEPGKYSASVSLTTDDEEAGIRFGPEEHTFEVGSEPMALMSFSQFLGEIRGSIVCLEPCKAFAISLRSVRGSSMTPRSTKSSHGKFSFKEVIPGDYLITIDKEEWCWKESTISVSVNAKEVGANFEQIGFRLTLNASHRTILNYITDSGVKGSISVAQGTSRECVSSPGKYTLTPSGCHRFKASTLTWDTSAPQLLSLSATHHKVSGSLVSSERSSFSILVIASEGQEVTLGPLSVSSIANLYNFDHWLSEGDSVTFIPTSPSNLFQYSPVNYELKMGNECLSSLVQFQAERALFVKGIIEPPIKSVDIKVVVLGSGEVFHYLTNGEGTFTAGPLDKSLKYRVTAEKLGYTISPASQDILSDNALEVANVSFVAYKLAEINVKIFDVITKEPLSSVLVSTSGGKDYRQNSLTVADGTIAFVALMPAEYFIRPMMKEYIFDPPSKMVEVVGGATVNVEISGSRVAYSIFGQTMSLSGEPEGDVFIEAIGIAPPCLEVQEEAVADAQGHFRIRGLMPKCDYKVVLKKGDGINKHVDRSLPEEKFVRMDVADHVNLKMIILRPFLQMDVSIFIHTEPQFLPSLSVQVFRDQMPDGPLEIVVVGRHPFFMLSPMTRDGLEYTVRLKSSLPLSQYVIPLPFISFKANSSFIRREMSFNPVLKSNEAEISRGTVVAFILFVSAIIVTLNYNKIQPLVTKGIDIYFTSTKRQNFKNSINMDTSNDSTTRKRVKVRKT